MKATSPSTFARFAIVRLLPGALFFNFAINLLLGWVIYGGDPQIPLLGLASIVVDSAIGTFLIAFFSYLAVAPVVRREARAGRIPGYGKAGIFLWLERNLSLGGLLFALVLTLVWVGGIYLFFSQQGISQLQTWPFLWFKGVYSAVVGGLASVWAGMLAARSAPEPHEDSRWCQSTTPSDDGLTYPCDYIDKGAIAVTNGDNGCSGTPTWQLVVEGALDPAHIRAAMADVVTRYPSLTMLVQSLDGHPEYATTFRYAQNTDFTLDSIFEEVDLRDAPKETLEELLLEHLNRHTDLFRDPPVTLTWVRTHQDRSRLLFRQHHGIADGRAFIELLEDFALYLNAARAGHRPSAEELEPIHRLPERDALGLKKSEIKTFESAGFNWFVGMLLRRQLRPTTHLLQNESNDYTGGNGTIHWVISDKTLEIWKPKSREYGVSLNSVLMAAVFDANRRWHREMGRELGKTVGTMPMETRPRDGSFRSFANHLATLEVQLELGKEAPTEELARSVHQQILKQRDSQLPIKRLLIEQKLVEGLAMDQLKSHVFGKRNAPDNVNFSNLIPLKIPTLEGEGWKIDEILITTPITPRHGILVTVIRYQGKLIFNINYKETAVTRDEAASLLSHFQASLEELLEYVPEELPSAAMETPPLSVEERKADPTSLSWLERPRWRHFLSSPSSGWVWALLAVLLTLPTLFVGLVLDDQLQKLKVEGQKSPHYSDARPLDLFFSKERPLDLFHFISDDNRKALLQSGAYPWWTAPKLQLAFFRPLSSLTHWLDFKVWPNRPVLMHLHTSLWLAILVLLASALYRGFLSVPWVAGLAGLLYAVDEAHGLGVGFLANRNALMATSFAILTMIVHQRWRRDGWSWGGLLGPLLLAVGLCTAEFTLFVTAYLFAYSVFLDTARSWKRFLPLLPYAVVVVAWRLLYNVLGYGAIQSGAYIDPLGEPLRFFLAVLERLPTLLLAQWTFVSADFWMVNSHTTNIIQATFGALFLGLIAWTLVPLLRRNAMARFWALGMMLSVLPICATFPHDRILFGVGIGAMGLIAQFIGYRYNASYPKAEVTDVMHERRAPSRSWGVCTLAAFFVVCHVYLATAFLPLKSWAPFFLGKLEARAFHSLPKTPEVTKKKVILLHSPGFLAHTMFAMSALANKPQPKFLCQLSISLKAMDIHRIDPYTLRLKAGDALVDRSTRFLVRSTKLSFRVGQVIHYNDITVTVTKLGKSGRPSEATFRFAKPLDDPSYVWMVWSGKGFVPFVLPTAGKTKHLQPISPTAVFL